MNEGIPLPQMAGLDAPPEAFAGANGGGGSALGSGGGAGPSPMPSPRRVRRAHMAQQLMYACGAWPCSGDGRART
jgi:hypothetical protein